MNQPPRNQSRAVANRPPHSQQPQGVSAPYPAQVNANPMLMHPAHWDRLEYIVQRAAQSGLLPKGVDNFDKAFHIALKGISLGLDALYALEHIAIVNGKATVDGQALLAIIYAKRQAARVEFPVPANEDTGVVRMRRTEKHEWTQIEFTIADAKRAELTSKDPWRKYPKQMLRWRAVSECARIVFPDVVAGLYLPEEMGANVDAQGAIIDVAPQRISNDVRTVAASVEAPPVETKEKTEELAPADRLPFEQEPASEKKPATEWPDPREYSWDSTEKQQGAIALLWALAKDAGWSEARCREHVSREFGKQSMKLLTWAEFNSMKKTIERAQTES